MAKKPIDDMYFKAYSPEKKPYDRIYMMYSAIDDCIVLFNRENAPRLRRILIFGSATGKVAEDFYHAFSVIPYGCEKNPWAHSQIPPKFRKRVALQDMREYVDDLILSHQQFDLGFSNSFQYLEKKTIPKFFEKLGKVCRYIHFHTSFKGNAVKDPYRKTLESYDWWNHELGNAGFTPLTDLWGERTYLWKNQGLMAS